MFQTYRDKHGTAIWYKKRGSEEPQITLDVDVFGLHDITGIAVRSPNSTFMECSAASSGVIITNADTSSIVGLCPATDCNITSRGGGRNYNSGSSNEKSGASRKGSEKFHFSFLKGVETNGIIVETLITIIQSIPFRR